MGNQKGKSKRLRGMQALGEGVKHLLCMLVLHDLGTREKAIGGGLHSVLQYHFLSLLVFEERQLQGQTP